MRRRMQYKRSVKEMIKIKQIKGEDILLRYNDIKQELEKALEYSSGEWTPAQVVQSAISDPAMFQIWEVQRGNNWIAIASSRVIQYNNFTSVHIMTLGGDGIKNDMSEVANVFESIIREHEGIDMIEYTGRRGFVKQLTTAGWKEKYTTMRKSLKENLDV